MKISFRTGHAITSMGDGRVVIGSNTVGIGHYMGSETLDLLKLNRIFEKGLNLSELLDEISDCYGIGRSESETLVKSLIDLGHVEDVEIYDTQRAIDYERYDRGISLISWMGGFGSLSRWEPQRKLASSSVCVLGAGGIGTSVAMQLVASGVGTLKLVDFDTVEISNLNRQFMYKESDIGKNKVPTLVERLRELNSSVEIFGYEQRVTSMKDVIDLAGNVDFIVKTIDDPQESAYWVSDAALQIGTPWIDCSYAGPMVVCTTFVPGLTGCYRCLRESEKRRLTAQGVEGLFVENPIAVNAAFAPVVSIAASLAAFECLKYILSGENASIGRALHQNLADYSQQYYIEVPAGCDHS